MKDGTPGGLISWRREMKESGDAQIILVGGGVREAKDRIVEVGGQPDGEKSA